jgi:hypothetical protein
MFGVLVLRFRNRLALILLSSGYRRRCTLSFLAVVTAFFLVAVDAAARADAGHGAKVEIEAAYAKRYKSAGILFLHGMRFRRALDFRAYDSSGNSLDVEEQEEKWRRFFGKALSASWSGKILRFTPISDFKVRCTVSEQLRVVLRDPLFAKRFEHTTTTLCTDVWELRSDVWEQAQSRILEQYQGSRSL